MTEPQTPPPLVIRIHDYVNREVEKENAALGVTDPKEISRRWRSCSDRIFTQTGQRIMAGTLTAYVFSNGTPQAIDIRTQSRHPMIRQVAAWLDGQRGNDSGIWTTNGPRPINYEWQTNLYLEDIDLAAELFLAKARIAEMEVRLRDLETGGVQIEGREAPELDAAISLYRAVASKPLPDGMTASQALTEKAEKMYPAWRAEAIKRIVAVSNWDKTTGRKK